MVRSRVLLLSYLGGSCSLSDFSTATAVRLLIPFPSDWFYGAALYIAIGSYATSGSVGVSRHGAHTMRAESSARVLA